MRHGQPVSAQPNYVHVRHAVDSRVVVANERDDMERQPTHSVDDDHDDDHFHQLGSGKTRR